MKIYTKTGDNGKTSLFGGERVEKDSLRIETYGTIDELSSFLGLAAAESNNNELKEVIFQLQNKLFDLGSDLATPISEKNKKLKIERTPSEYITELEQDIDKFSLRLDELKSFILPGGTKAASLLHICRTVCRRAERLCVTLVKKEEINNNIVIFLNRLSDFLFVLARYANTIEKTPDILRKK